MAEDLAHSKAADAARGIVALTQAVYPIPGWLLWLAVLIACTLVVLADRLNLPALLAAWAKAAEPAPPHEAPAIPVSGDGTIHLDQKPMEPQP